MFRQKCVCLARATWGSVHACEIALYMRTPRTLSHYHSGKHPEEPQQHFEPHGHDAKICIISATSLKKKKDRARGRYTPRPGRAGDRPTCSTIFDAESEPNLIDMAKSMHEQTSKHKLKEGPFWHCYPPCLYSSDAPPPRPSGSTYLSQGRFHMHANS